MIRYDDLYYYFLVDKLSVAVSLSFKVKYDLQQARLQKPVTGSAKCQDLWYASGWTLVHTAVRRPLALEKLQTFLEIKRYCRLEISTSEMRTARKCVLN